VFEILFSKNFLMPLSQQCQDIWSKCVQKIFPAVLIINEQSFGEFRLSQCSAFIQSGSIAPGLELLEQFCR